MNSFPRSDRCRASAIVALLLFAAGHACWAGPIARLPEEVHRQIEGEWKFAGRPESLALTGKRPGVQGPIDDAFAAPFLCVRGTGRAWNPIVGAWADASLRRFAYEWPR